MANNGDYLERLWIEVINLDPDGGWIDACVQQCRYGDCANTFGRCGNALERLRKLGARIVATVPAFCLLLTFPVQPCTVEHAKCETPLYPGPVAQCRQERCGIRKLTGSPHNSGKRLMR